MRYPAKSSGSLPDSRRVLASGPRFAAFSQFLGPGQCAATDRMEQSAWATTIDETGGPSRVEVDRIENAGVESRDSCRGTTNAIERLHEEVKRRIKTQTVLPSAETAAMLFWAVLAAGQITMRKVDGWQTLPHKLADKPIDLAA